MNKVYRVVWSKANRTWVAVSEITKSCGKDTRSSHQKKTKSPSRSNIHKEYTGYLNKIVVAMLLSIAFDGSAMAVIGGTGSGASSTNVTQADTNGNIASGSGSYAGNAGGTGQAYSFAGGAGGTGGTSNYVAGGGTVMAVMV